MSKHSASSSRASLSPVPLSSSSSRQEEETRPERSFSRLSLTSEPSPSAPRNGQTSPRVPSDGDPGDIGYAVAPSPRPQLQRSFSRQITPSRSPSPSTSPARRLQAIATGSSGSSSPKRSRTPPLPSASPQPRFIPFKPPLPTHTVSLDGPETPFDSTAPFESIPLQTTPPLPPVTGPLPISPRHVKSDFKGKRSSWSGYGMKNGQHHANNSAPALNGDAARRSSALDSSNPNEAPNLPVASGSASTTPPRLHAPPAHPHPYSLSSTSSPPSNGTRRLPPRSTTPPPALGVKGISTFEKVISHTRPSWLPPKDKVEDETHLHQWEEMMARARSAQADKRKVDELRRLEKEKRMAMSTPRWEVLLNGPDFSPGKVKADLGLRRLWFEGVPSHLRGRAWSLAIGNPLALSRDSYKSFAARARRAIESGRFPKGILERIERDMDDTLPTMKLFTPGSPLREDLRDILCAWVVYRSDEGHGYAPYINLVAAMLLLTSPLPTAFLSLVNMISRPCLSAFFTQTTDEIEAYYRVFENLQADTFPKIYANCKNLGLRLPESYFRSLLVEQVPFEAACRLWDQIMLDGDQYIFRAALAIFGFLEPRLHYPDREEIISVLEGRDRATLAISERERERARLRNEPFLEGMDGKLSVFGLNEAALFDWLEEDGWKESRFDRLVQREMPD